MVRLGDTVVNIKLSLEIRDLTGGQPGNSKGKMIFVKEFSYWGLRKKINNRKRAIL